MKVLIVNTSERTGGAAVAARRLMEALNNHGVKTKMLVRDKETDSLTVCQLPRSPLLQWHFLWERLVIFLHLRLNRRHLFEIDIANAGTDITRLQEFKEADVIHLHWINQGMLSLASIQKILNSGKPVVWTMHDIWPATAICHYARGCTNYKSTCRHCPRLPDHGGEHDLANRIWNRKKKILDGQTIYYVTCSQWLGTEAAASALLQGQKVMSIPNTINTHIYCPADKAEARKQAGLPADKKLILFVSQRVNDTRKGMTFLTDALQSLVKNDESLKQKWAVAVMGGHAEELTGAMPLPAFPLGYVNNEQLIVNIYRSADVFITPSLEDNLPNTIMEAMACGVPCVGFRVGGIPEMIDHRKNGYVARYRDTGDLAAGLRWVLEEADYEALCHQAVRKVAHSYSQQTVALHYTELYQQAIAFKHYRL